MPKECKIFGMFYLDLFRALERERVRYLMISELALNIHGVERANIDSDLMLAMDSDNLNSFPLVARDLQLQPAMPASLNGLADPAQLNRWSAEKHMLDFALPAQESSAPHWAY